MRNITKIFILVFSLILLLAVSCSNDDKTGVKNNPPEDMEITDGETGSGGTGSGSSSGGSSETETGGETGGSEEGEGGTEIPTSEPETPPTTSDGIEEGDFPPPAGDYKSDARRREAGVFGSYFEPKVSYDETTKKTKIDGDLILHGSNTEENNGKYESRNAEFNVSK